MGGGISPQFFPMGDVYSRYNLGLYNSGTYTPFLCDISAVNTGQTTTITTTLPHGFVIGNEVQFIIPDEWGIIQLDEQVGYISSIPTASSFVVDIDSSGFDQFINPSTPPHVVIDPAQVVPIGDSNTGQYAPGGTLPVPNVPPGTFENQPP